MATINGVEVIGDKTAHDFDLLDKDDGINLANGVERNREATEDNHQDIVLHRTDRDVHVTPEWKNSLVTKEILGLYWTAAQTADIINEISIAGGAKLVKVDALPETGKEQTIYLVPKTDPQERDIFDEFVWIDGKFEFIGTTKVDLSNYATKTELNAKQDDLSNQQLSNIADVVNKANASDLTAHTNNADIHVTTSDKANWNAKQDALSNQQLSNIADVANKATDADVVHKNGNETVYGSKTFTSRLTYKATNTIAGDSTSSNFAGSFNFTDKNDVQLGTLGLGVYNNNGYTEQVLNIINPAWFNDDTRTKSFAVRLRVIHETGEVSFTPGGTNAIDLGTSSFRWKTINGLNPGALSLPNVSADVVTVDTTTFQWGTNWSYTPVFDGWISVWVPASSATKRRYSASQEYLRFWYPNQNGEIFRFTMPVVKGVPVGFGFISDIEEPAAPNIYLLKALGNV